MAATAMIHMKKLTLPSINQQFERERLALHKLHIINKTIDLGSVWIDLFQLIY